MLTVEKRTSGRNEAVSELAGGRARGGGVGVGAGVGVGGGRACLRRLLRFTLIELLVGSCRKF